MFDTTFDGEPIMMTGLNFQNSGGSFGTRLPAYRSRVMYAVEDSAIQSPTSIDINNPSTLSAPTNGANLIIITYKDFKTQADAWADYRRGQGFTVEVVDVADVFDEFNYGVLSSDSIKAFFSTRGIIGRRRRSTFCFWVIRPTTCAIIKDMLRKVRSLMCRLK